MAKKTQIVQKAIPVEIFQMRIVAAESIKVGGFRRFIEEKRY
jgi:hypothetical protein